jgi:hypothetical protein
MSPGRYGCGMAPIDFTRDVNHPVERAWARLTSFTDHGRFVPFTTVSLIDPTAPGGGGFIARTAVPGAGRLAFDDVNVIEIWRPPTADVPGLCQLRKTGRLVGGWARLTVTPLGSGSRVRWQEQVSLPLVPSFGDPVIARIGAVMFGRVVDGLMREDSVPDGQHR